jgi:hypothetical protein
VHAYLEAARGEEPLWHLLSDDPDGVDDAREVAEEGEQQVDSELDLQKHVQHQQSVNPTLDGITLRRKLRQQHPLVTIVPIQDGQRPLGTMEPAQFPPYIWMSWKEN